MLLSIFKLSIFELLSKAFLLKVIPQIQDQDQNLVKLNTEIKNSDLCVEFIEKSLAVLEKMNFQVKNVIDIIKLEQS